MSASLSKTTDPVTTIPDGVSEDPASANPEQLSALLTEAQPTVWTREQLVASQALQLLMRLERELREARAQWNQDWFRRVMGARSRAVLRLRRRWTKLNTMPAIHLGSLRRRYHPNLARYLSRPD